MKKGFVLRLTMIVLCLLVLTTCLTAFAANVVPFSADMVQTVKKKDTIGKIFVKQNKIRQELVDDKGQATITILRMDKMVVWVLMPADKMYMEIDLAKNKTYQYYVNNPDMIADTEDLGTETVNGYVCQKVQYTYKDKSLGTMVQWFSQRLQFAIKMEMKSRSVTTTIEYRNIVEGPQPDSLFEVPADYEKFAMPSFSF
ncbi:MAG: DUF4412 domain-containing protein [Patescibacteria group bacterium]